MRTIGNVHSEIKQSEEMLTETISQAFCLVSIFYTNVFDMLLLKTANDTMHKSKGEDWWVVSTWWSELTSPPLFKVAYKWLGWRATITFFIKTHQVWTYICQTQSRMRLPTSWADYRGGSTQIFHLYDYNICYHCCTQQLKTSGQQKKL